ncbi:VOC family protein [Variovorax guangxiensis]|uniref:VOC family protein n=1 Tax=Variovorax guangxiensis TaxID=1775474 RepID=UPI00285B5850|nr:VOC family protein [Variovorax guangxiensis]MDR6858782.1 catechol 2,3-dioxygenase-like lactoylglutathione lyase family enzyme [Variovorax guangxiensis]
MIAAPHRKFFPAFLGERMQLAFVVPHLDEALRFWTETLKVGPFVVIENAMSDRHFVHRAQPSAVEMSLAFSYIGETQIEVIAQTNSAASPYKEFLDSGRQGLQHVAFWPDDWAGACQELERSGFQEVCSAEAASGGGKVVYYSGPAHLGVMLEIAPMTAERARYFGGIKALADSWDGSRPVRKFCSRADYLASDDCKAASGESNPS